MLNARTTAAVIGRLQLSHWAHLHLINSAFNLADQVVIVLGSAWRSRNAKNPFTFQERKEMLLAALSHEQRARVRFVGVRDVYDDDRWVSLVRREVERCCEPEEKVTLVGYSKDASSYYLAKFPGWGYVDAGSTIAVDATQLRNILFSGEPFEKAVLGLQPYMHDGTLAWLEQWVKTPVFAERLAEHQATIAYKLRYPGPEYHTGDAIIEAADRFLMVERGGVLGHGLLAWPGGHSEEGEEGVDAAIRELDEETTLGVSAQDLRECLVKSKVFDAPSRSPRGRIITTAGHFRLPGYTPETLPVVIGKDDAKPKVCPWLTKSEFAARMHEMFDDHDVVGEWVMGPMEPLVALQAA